MNIISDYISLFIIRWVLFAFGSRPAFAMLFGSIIGVIVITIGALISSLVIVRILLSLEHGWWSISSWYELIRLFFPKTIYDPTSLLLPAAAVYMAATVPVRMSGREFSDHCGSSDWYCPLSERACGVRSIGHPDFQYTPWSPERRAAASKDHEIRTPRQVPR